MVKPIVGTALEHRWMDGQIEINSINDIIQQTNKPYIKAMFLLPSEDYPSAKVLEPTENFRHLAKEVDWRGTQLLGVACITPEFGTYYLEVFNWKDPVVTIPYFWKEIGEIVKVNQPRPCTREREVIYELTKSYSELIKTGCGLEDLKKYAETWPEPRKLA